MNSKLSDQVFLPLSARLARKLLPTARNSGTAAVIRGLGTTRTALWRRYEARVVHRNDCLSPTLSRRHFGAGAADRGRLASSNRPLSLFHAIRTAISGHRMMTFAQVCLRMRRGLGSIKRDTHANPGALIADFRRA